MTPIQTAMFKIAQMRQTENENVLMKIDANQVATILSDLRLDEQKLISDTWDAAITWNVNDGWIQIEESAPPPDKQTYMKSLNY